MTLLSTLRPSTNIVGTGLVDDNFDADTLGSPPSGYTVESGTLWQVLAYPVSAGNLLSGRVLVGSPDTVNDGFIRRQFTRQVDAEIRIAWDVHAGSVSNPARSGVMQIFDTTGAYVASLGPINGAWTYGNTTGNGGAVGSWVGGGQYQVVMSVNMDTKKYKFAINNVPYDNGGLLYPLSTGTVGIDRFKLSAYSPSTAAFNLDTIQIARLEPAAVPPTGTGTLSTTGTFDGVTLGADRYGRVVLGYDNSDALISRLVLERSSDNATWADISAYDLVTSTGTGRWTVIDKRPQYGAQSVPYGGTVYYRVSGANSGGATPSSTSGPMVADVNVPAFLTNRFSDLSAIMAGSAVPSSSAGEPYSILWLSAMAFAYAKTGVAQYLTDASNEFAHIQTQTHASGTVQFPDYADFLYRDHHWRTVLYVAACSRLLRRVGAVTLADSMIAQCDSWTTSFYALDTSAPLTSVTRAGWDANNQSLANAVLAWQASTTYALGAIVRPTATNSRTYRATSVTTGVTAGTQPTWPTTNAGTVVDGGVTWTETTVSGNVTYARYDATAPYAPVAGTELPDINQNLEECAALALMLTDPTSALFTAGATRTAALTHINDSTRVMTAYATSTGAIPIGDNVPASDGPEGYDTLYGGYTLLTAAVALRFAPTQCDAWLDEMIRNGLAWLNTAYGTEPLGTMHFSGVTVTTGGEITSREYPALVFGVANPIEKLRWTAAANDPVSDGHGDYDAVGNVTPYANALQGRYFQADVFLELLRLDTPPPVVMAPMLAA